eukprot:TRINITY_DN23426_c0_g1_i1.p1 TRINITY_DN23426_c0_g1~~TRINITY_DN23426_c0_g1_i1.p1  ORF type:complete len:100 (+),score=0.87 TRINITY_DN23426_c0_g1_i1:204-503(+)
MVPLAWVNERMTCQHGLSKEANGDIAFGLTICPLLAQLTINRHSVLPCCLLSILDVDAVQLRIFKPGGIALESKPTWWKSSEGRHDCASQGTQKIVMTL